MSTALAITLDDVEWWIEVLGESFEQSTDTGADSIKRLENLRDALQARASLKKNGRKS